MSDFKSQQEIWQWLAESCSNRVISGMGTEIGFNKGKLWNFTDNAFSDITFRHPSNWSKIKPKVKYLKPLHQILNENPGYRFRSGGHIDHNNWCFYLHTEDFKYLDASLDPSLLPLYDDSWIEEREEV